MLIDLTGQRFGRLTVLQRDENRPKGHGTQSYWLCKCDCGNITSVQGTKLRNNWTKSCGCYHKERARDANIIHGMTGTPLHEIWRSMIARCTTHTNPNWKNYGGRGITVCERWLNSFENFYKDMKEGYKYGLQIDRIDNNKGYSPKNCRWVTQKQNANNKRSNHYIVIDGITHTVAEWCDILKIKRSTVYARVYKGWDFIKALTIPTHKRTMEVRNETC